jgi:hypothetical protein
MRVGHATQHGASSADFSEAGYAQLAGFLNPQVLAAVRRAVRVALEAPPVVGCDRPHNRLAPLRWNDPPVDLILAGKERRRAVAAATSAEDLCWISGYVSVKEPRTPALGWHQDWWCWDHPVSLRRASAQVALLSSRAARGAVVRAVATLVATSCFSSRPGARRGSWKRLGRRWAP